MHYVKAKSILTAKPCGMNIYRGCTHGCIYCDSRSTCYRTPVPFEDIEVKQNAVELLEEALCKKRKKCMVGTGAMSDPYMHCEKELQMTRKCLEVLERYGPEIGIPCPDEEGIHIFDDYVYIESLDPATGLPVLEGELGEVTLTTFVKEGTPLFRFRTHNLAAFVPGQCKCGS